MRKQLCESLLARALNPEMVFLTGDLGFMALEPLQEQLGSRFVNAGIAEQNMISVAAGLAKQGLEVWAYSIAPFIYARPFEQIRNDLAFHNLPVKLIGNGGGYAYGVMGPTHHAIDDYGSLLTLPNLSVFIPVFDEDVACVVERAGISDHPVYIRMGLGEPPKGFPVPSYAPWRQLTYGKGAVVIAVGPLAGSYIASFNQLPIETRPNLWCVSELPISRTPPPADLISQISNCSVLCVAEEHVRQGSFGADLLLHLAEHRISIDHFEHRYARAHHFDRYGSQSFMRAQSQLDANSVISSLRNGCA